MLLDLFINAGWYTVPLKGELRRLESGKKTLPIFEREWRKKYTEHFNGTAYPLAAAITGAKSGVIAIDCDNQVTYDMFRALDTANKFVFLSKDKPEGGGTFIYKYTDKVGGFILKTEMIALDFFSDEGAIYLPTENNFTKESWIGVDKLPELLELPDTMLALLQALKAKVRDREVLTNQPAKVISNRLAPLLETFTANNKYEPSLFKILTPYSFRDLPSYVLKGHLHPMDVPKGRGSEYLSKVSAVLGSDISVDVELYTKTMLLINSFRKVPKENNVLLTTIINPMIEERSNINGKVIWQYDPHWEKMGFIATAINGNYIESFFDDIKGTYYLINYSVPYVRIFSEKRSVITTARSLLGRGLTESQYDITKQIVRTMLNPSLEFGHIEGSESFNLFRQSPELAIINSPLPYANNYVEPTTILNYFKSLVPDEQMRNYLLRFIRTKLTTFKYSPVVLYLIGKPGSGKDTLVNILRKIIGDDYVAKPDTKVFIEQYNGWIIDKFFVQLDEYGNKLTRSGDKQEVLGKLKAYTGSAELQIRAMRTDGYNYLHSITFIITANTNPLPVEVDDRRFAFIKTPNKLEMQPWVQEMGGISVMQDKLKTEIMDFCYYLGTEVTNLPFDSYVIAPMTEDKEKMMLDNMPALEQILYYIQNSQYESLLDLAIDYNIPQFDIAWEQNRLYDEKLDALYSAMTEGAGSHRALIRGLKNIGVHRAHTTRNGTNLFYYFIHDIHLCKRNYYSEKEITNIIKGLNDV